MSMRCFTCLSVAYCILLRKVLHTKELFCFSDSCRTMYQMYSTVSDLRGLSSLVWEQSVLLRCPASRSSVPYQYTSIPVSRTRQICQTFTCPAPPISPLGLNPHLRAIATDANRKPRTPQSHRANPLLRRQPKTSS